MHRYYCVVESDPGLNRSFEPTSSVAILRSYSFVSPYTTDQEVPAGCIFVDLPVNLVCHNVGLPFVALPAASLAAKSVRRNAVSTPVPATYEDIGEP